MFRILVLTLFAIFLITVIRMIVGVLAKGMGDLFRAETAAKASPNRPPAGAGGGALKRDPVCGTYIPIESSVRKVVSNETLYFCSTECRDRYGS
jgi:uncharacterized protein